MSFTAYIGSAQGMAKYTVSGLPGGNPALLSVNCIEAGRLRVAFTRAMDFSYPATLEPGNYVYTYGGNRYPVFFCLQYDAQTVDLFVPIIADILITATAHLKVLEGRDPRGIALDGALNETDFTALGVVWASSPTHLTALMGTVEGLEVDDLPSNWLGSSATLLLTKRKAMKIQFQSTEKLRVRLPPFLNKNDWSYIMGTDAATFYIKCPDGTVLQTGVGGVPTPTYDTDVRMWSVDLDVSYYTAHQHVSTNEWRIYAVSNDANYVPQWASYFWGDYVDDVTTAKTSAGSVDTKLTTARAGYLDNLNVSGPVASQADVAAIQNNTSTRISLSAIFVRPLTGTTSYVVELYLYDEAGHMVDPDSTPTLQVTNQLGASRNANLSNGGVLTHVTTGHYTISYNVSSTHDIESLEFEFTIIEGGLTRLAGAHTNVILFTDVVFDASDRANIEAIKAQTDNLPSDPADQSLVTASIGVVEGKVDTALTRIGTPSSDLATQLAALATDVTMLKKIGTGRWRVTTGNQLIIYDTDGVTPLLRFNLKDLVGLPTSDNIYERTPA